jgi:hypothetical protein
MLIALRPVAVRTLLLLAGILLGLVTVLATFAVAEGTSSNAAAVSSDSADSDNTLIAGTRWR